MVRPRKFERAEVVEAALLLFWKQGFAATSIGELSEATGLGRQSLYNTFGDKSGLFLETLAMYRSRLEAGLVPLEAPDAGLPELRAYIEGALATQAQLGSGACMLVSTAYGPSHDDAAVADAVRAGAQAVRRTFERLVRRGIDRGELRSDLGPGPTAAMLYTLLNGLSALGRTGGTARQRRAVLEHNLDSLRV